MDSLKLLLYILARIGLMLLLCVFGAFVGVILFPSLCNLMPGSWMSVKNILIDQSNESIIAFAICTIIMVRVFYNDGKIHAAYEEWSSITITTVLLLMIFFYFIPAIFYTSFSSEGKGEVFYLVFYYPSVWLRDGFGLEYTVSVLVGMGATLLLCFAAYLISFRLYVKKHPVILKRMQEPPEPDDDEEDDDDDPDPWDE
ncbi:MAG: hypothetical protein IJ571_04995 [Ruminococcus sp.]|nr:hypothetical protein [Ruminococcus sp.]